MKPIYFPFAAACLWSVIGLSSCSGETDTPAIPEKGASILIVPSVEETIKNPVSRSGVTTLTNLSSKHLVLNITQNATEASDPYNYKGLEYIITADGNVTFTSGTTDGTSPKWKAYTSNTERQDVTIKARWPLATEVPTDQSGDRHTEADFFYFAGKPTVTGNLMQFTLGHVNSKIRINLKHGTGFEWGTTDESKKTVTLTTKELVYATKSENGLWKADNNGIPVLSTTSPSASYTAHQEITITSGQDETFEVIILPQEMTDMSKLFKIIAGTKTYYFNMSGTYTFESGKTYTFNLRLGKDQVTLDGGIGVTDWTEEILPPSESEDESRVQTAADLTSLINTNQTKHTNDNSFRASVIYSGSEEIPTEAFKDLLWLTRFVATKNIMIGADAFSGCTNLTELVFATGDALMDGITNDTFDGPGNTTDIKLIIGAKEYDAITSVDLSAKTWRGQTWKSITRY